MKLPLLIFAGIMCLSAAGWAKGGEVGGGGNSMPLAPSYFDFNTLVYVIEDSKPLLHQIADDIKPHLDLREYAGRDLDKTPVVPRKLRIIARKLYDGPRTIHDVLDQMVVEVRANRPCATKLNRYAEPSNNVNDHRDASTVVSGGADICVSFERLSKKKIRSYELDAVIIGLLMHEATHLLGGNEEEAQKVQSLAMERVSERLVRLQGRHFEKISVGSWSKQFGGSRANQKIRVKINALDLRFSKKVRSDACLKELRENPGPRLTEIISKIRAPGLSARPCSESLGCGYGFVRLYTDSSHSYETATYRFVAPNFSISETDTEEVAKYEILIPLVSDFQPNEKFEGRIYLDETCRPIQVEYWTEIRKKI